METATSIKHQCRYCNREFQRERSLTVHVCEPKRRYQEQNDRGVQLGFQAYVKFFEMSHGSARLKTFDDFVESQYYRAFTRWGRYCLDIRAVNPEAFLTWLLRNNKKIDAWCSDRMYEEFLHFYLPREGVQDALKRSIEEIQQYIDQNPELADIGHYFLFANTNRVCHHITTGRISAWTVYCSKSGIEFLDRLPADQTAMVLPWIDPDTWQRKFNDTPADVEWAKYILEQAGL